MAIPIKLSQSITYFGTAEKVMPYHIFPTALPVGVSQLRPSSGIIYGMLKNGTEYRMPVVESSGENR